MSNRVHRYPYHQNVSSAAAPVHIHQGNHHHRHHHHPHSRNAWSADCGSNSSSSGRASAPYAAQQGTLQSVGHRQQPGSRHSQHYTHEHAVQAIVRPVTPASSSPGYSTSGQGGCGGHCSVFDNFCNIFLQVVYSLGILTGIGLFITGMVLGGTTLPNEPSGDLFVLVYIGTLIALVCTLLLSIQCSVGRNVRQRRAMIARGGCGSCNAYNSASGTGGSTGGVHRGQANNRTIPIPLQEMSRKPLLAQLAHHTTAIDNQRHQSQHHGGHHMSGPPSSANSGIYHEPYRSESLDVSRSGTPWWRRENLGTLNSGTHPRPQPHTAPGWR